MAGWASRQDEGSQEFHLLSDLVQGKATLRAAVEDIVKLTCEAVLTADEDDQEALRIHFGRLWSSVYEVAARTPPSGQAPLVDFMFELRQWEIPEPESEVLVRHHWHDQVRIWTDLPSIGINMRDICDGGKIQYMLPRFCLCPRAIVDTLPTDICFDLTATPVEQRRTENRIAFLAQFWAASPQDVLECIIDLATYSLWTFREAFECGPEPGAKSPAAIRGVCMWIVYAADRLWWNVTKERSLIENCGVHDRETKLLRRAIGVKRFDSFNRARWDYWIGVLEQWRDGKGDPSTAALVERAMLEVERVMDQGWRIREPERYA